MSGQQHAPTALYPPGKTRYPFYRRLGGSPVSVWSGAENLVPTGIGSPDRPARSQSLYQLSYPAHIVIFITVLKHNIYRVAQKERMFLKWVVFGRVNFHPYKTAIVQSCFKVILLNADCFVKE